MSGSPPFKVSEPAPDDAARLTEQRERNLSRRARRKERAAAAAQDPPPGRPMSLNERLDRIESMLLWLIAKHDPELGSELIELLDGYAKTMQEVSMTPEQEQALGLRTTRVHGLRFTGTSTDGNTVIDVPVSLIAIPPAGWAAALMEHDEGQRGRRDGGDDDD